ncbi:dephospho-CoA kinase [Candidatus Woesearchaeota archaeon]|nr:dephospho-CoA kinase [Candidatus Woesearchaeota archaeon]
MISFLTLYASSSCMIVALTGNIGSGKSEVAKIFRKAGYRILNTDKIAHQLYKRGDIREKTAKAFGKKILTNGRIDRRKLKDVVFYSHSELRKLNKIIHPEIIKEIRKRSKGKTLIEGALLIEAGFRDYDKLILVTIDKEKQIQRLLEKGKYREKELENIIRSQMPQEKKLKYADYIIDNSGTKKELEKNVRKLVKEFNLLPHLSH